MRFDDLVKLFTDRVSVRNYSERRINTKDIEKIIKAARWAPTSCNRQSWKVVVVREGTEAFNLLAKINAGGIGFAKKAPVLLLVVVDLRSYWMPMEMNFPINDGSIVASYIMLSARALEMDTCWISWQASLRNKKRLYEEIGLESYYFPVCVLSLGYRKSDANPIPREKAEYYIIEKSK